MSKVLLAASVISTLGVAYYIYSRKESESSVVINSEKDDDLFDPESFDLASAKAKNLDATLSEQLRLYGLFKRVTKGRASTFPQPPAWEISNRAKYDAWLNLSHLSRQEAADHYQALVNSLMQADKESETVKRKSSTGGPQVSRFVTASDGDVGEGDLNNNYDQAKTVLDKEEKLKTCLKEDPSLIVQRDLEQRSLLHWAADGNHVKAIELLIDQGADINAMDDEELTPLAYAVCNNYLETVSLLVNRGANKDAAMEFARGEMEKLLKIA